MIVPMVVVMMVAVAFCSIVPESEAANPTVSVPTFPTVEEGYDPQGKLPINVTYTGGE